MTCYYADGSVVQLERKRAKIFTNKYSCHKGRSFVMPNENEFFCPDNSCQFRGPLDSVLDHVKDVHSIPIQRFSYGDVIMRIPLHLVDKYLVLQAEDDATFVLWGEDIQSSKLLSVVYAEQFSSCGSKFTFDVTHDLSPEVLGWLKRQPVISDRKKVRSHNTVGSSIVMYGKNVDVRGISGAKCRITQYCITNSDLGNMAIVSQLALIVVPKSCKWNGKWYGDIVLSISTI